MEQPEVTMRVTILYFASLREIAGRESEELEFKAGASLGELRSLLVERWPAMASVPFVFARNEEYAGHEELLTEGDEVALVPAISGGSGEGGEPERISFGFTQEPIDARPLEEEVRRDEDGAVLTFHGVTRNHHEGQGVATLSYECFEGMARKQMMAILREVLAAKELGRIAMRHRLGEVPIGEASVVLTISAPHRGPCFEAVAEIMDRLKKEVPIFKKEFLAEGGEHWVGDLPEKP